MILTHSIVNFIRGLRLRVPAAVLLLIASACNNKPVIKDHYNSFREMAAHFQDPPASFRTVPFWVWNERVDSATIDEQLKGFKETGFGGVFVHPRYGLITEYLSDEWFNLVKYAAQRAGDLGLQLWLYDENSFPSGFAGGHVPDRMPESWKQGQALVMHSREVFDPAEFENPRFVFILNEGIWIDITGSMKDYKGKKANFRIFDLHIPQGDKWHGGFGYVDLLYPGVTQKFIEVTMTGYEKTLGEQFGKTVPGIFTDEPNINPGARGAIRWTPDLFDAFREKWGYDLQPVLVSLKEETGEWMRIRHNYYSLLLDLFIKRWAEPWKEYTDAKGLKWTGHYWEHGWPDPVHGGDNMAMYPYHQVPGIDMLFNTRSTRPDQFGNVRAVKELASIANQFGQTRTLSETYGASGYELDFLSMKRNGDWQYALGVNLMNQHLSYQSMLGDRKHDFPQTFSYHVSWWDTYRLQADYFARLSLALSSGKQMNPVLVIEPTTSAWMYYAPGKSNPLIDTLDHQFTAFLNGMEKFKYPYDLGAEKTMRDFANVSNGKLTIRERSYELVVIPPGVSGLDLSSLKLLGSLLEQGGKVLSFAGEPQFVDGSGSDEFLKLARSYPNLWLTAENLTDEMVSQLLSDKRIVFREPEKDAEQVYMMHRQLSDGELLFFANYAEGSTKEFEINLPHSKHLVELDPSDGKYYHYPVVASEKGISLKVTLEDAGSKLFFASDKKPHISPETRGEWEPSLVSDASGLEIRRDSPNTIALDYCYLDFPGGRKDKDKLLYYYVAHDSIFRKHGFPDNPWVSSSQFKTQILDRDTFGTTSGFTLSFPFTIEDGVDFNSMTAVVERPKLYRVFVNGTEVNPNEGEWFLDKGTGVYPIGEHLKTGTNNISLVASPFSVHHEIAPLILTGNFGLWPSGQGWILGPEIPVSYGSWRKQGMPFYSGSLSYSRNLKISDPDKKVLLSLGKWSGMCAEVLVNDRQVKVLGWPPYQADLTTHLKTGDNKITVRIYGSLKNLVGPFHFVRTPGLVTPWSFKYAPEKQPAGLDYDQFDYGLEEAFLIEME